MSARCFTAVSEGSEPDAAAAEILEALRVAGAGEGDSGGSFGLLFATPELGGALGPLASAMRREGLAAHVAGTTAEGVLSDGRELESGPGLSAWLLRGGGGRVEPLRVSGPGAEDFEAALASWDGEEEPPTVLLLADPFRLDVEALLRVANEPRAVGGEGVGGVRRGGAPRARVVGGMSSGARRPGGNTLALDDATHKSGGVGLILGGGARPRVIVSQGCRPIGRHALATRVEENVIRELGRRPTVEVLREQLESLEPEELAIARRGLHLGRVVNEYQDSFGRGDFLVRNVVGVEPGGGLVVNDRIRVGQTVQFHIRDARTAREDLEALLASAPEEGAAGALVFTCNGRGTRLFETANHDAEAVRRRFGGLPAAGFFAMGEIGPVGDRAFVHGFTAVVATFHGDSGSGSGSGG